MWFFGYKKADESEIKISPAKEDPQFLQDLQIRMNENNNMVSELFEADDKVEALAFARNQLQ